MKQIIIITMLMSWTAQIQAQNWLDSLEYPFNHHYQEVKAGKMHYIDEGEGEIILFLHGTPTWSFLYRKYIKALSKTYRCIAIDHIGFGLSEKPADFDGTPEKHSEHLEEFINQLGLKNITLVVHDFGGVIGLPYAVRNPENIKQIVMFNTWLWETKKDKEAQKIDKILRGGMGKFLYLNMNFSPKVLLKKGFYDKKKLSKSVHKQYKKPFPSKSSRYGLLKIGQSLVGSSDWYQENWEQIDKIKDKPFLVLWGMKDTFITPERLEKWKSKLTNATVVEYEAGHFVQEEQAEKSIQKIQDFLTNQK